MNPPADTPSSQVRIQVFVDFWNLQLTLNERVSEETDDPNPRFHIDWHAFPRVASAEAARIVGAPNFVYQGTNVYASYDTHSRDQGSFHHWLRTWLDRQPGIQVFARERRAKRPPDCPECHRPILTCPHCNEAIRATTEKGVDTALVTDMIRLAWEDAYEVAVVASLDADLVPAVEFLSLRGRKIIQAGFPPKGLDLATSCWASFDLFALRNQFERT